jgi:ribonuclease HI
MDQFATKGNELASCLFHKSNASFDISSRLKTYCTSNQAEYKALLFGLEFLNCMGAKHVRAFSDS